MPLFCMIFGRNPSLIVADAMKPIKLRVPRNEVADFADDLTVWISSGGGNPALETSNEPEATLDEGSSILCRISVSESFFEQFPQWRMRIEQ